MARLLDAVTRYRAGRLSCVEAAELLGMSERHFRRLRDRYAAEGRRGADRSPAWPGVVPAGAGGSDRGGDRAVPDALLGLR